MDSTSFWRRLYGYKDYAETEREANINLLLRFSKPRYVRELGNVSMVYDLRYRIHRLISRGLLKTRYITCKHNPSRRCRYIYLTEEGCEYILKNSRYIDRKDLVCGDKEFEKWYRGDEGKKD